MSVYVLDTNALMHHAAGRRARMGARARAVFEDFEARRAALYVPAPVLVETWMAERAGRFSPHPSLAGWWRRLELGGLQQVALEPADVVAARELDWDHPDLYDRLVVATALRLGAPLVTGDRAIAEWGGVEVVW